MVCATKYFLIEYHKMKNIKLSHTLNNAPQNSFLNIQLNSEFDD